MKTFSGCILVFTFAMTVGNIAVAQTCLNLSKDVGFGATDTISDGLVYQLQTYLHSSNLLSATPTGYFGPATLSAVKAFQLTNGISATGNVGPMTRASLSKNTCTVAVQTVTPPPAPTIPTGSVTSPSVGQVLPIGSSTVIRWDKVPTGNFNITLEQPGGMGAGFIAQDQSSGTEGNQYIWKVGKILASSANGYQTISAGTYRIRLQGTNAGSNPTDLTSGWFTIVSSQFGVSKILPPSALNDNDTSVVLFGSGFTPSASVYFDTNNSGLRATKRYISPDGTVLVFTTPTNVPTGPHTLYVNDGQSSEPATLSFTVTALR